MTSQAESLRRFVALRPPHTDTHAFPHVTVVAAGKGGAGTSTISALLAAAAANQGVTTLLVDGHETPGSLALLLALPSGVPGAQDDGVRTIAPGLSLLGRSGPVAQGTAERRIRYRRLTAQFNDFRCVIVDAGSRVDDVMIALSTRAGRLLLVTTADRVSIAASYALIKATGEHATKLPVGVIVNRCQPVPADAAFGALLAGTERFLQHSLELAAVTPDDERLAESMDAGTLLEYAATGVAAAMLQPVALQLLAGTPLTTLLPL